ncbi:MAG: CDP-diacylglycerol--glycerol-3-phosphate 3-phosphatidyltransferase [Devosia sp.]|nr:CDP-diacylglycerol--glycerol-3-phosphate 3-phosphatidyltransferase [Devosia sp.]
MPNASPYSVPNLLTYARIVAIPVICVLILMADPTLRAIALVLYILAAITDWLDGYLARAWNQSSPLGRMLDPIADKLLVGALIVVLAYDHSLSALDLIPAIAIMIREIFVSGLREFMGATNVVVHVTPLAKWKTTIQLVAIVAILLERLLPLPYLVGDVLLWAAGILTVWTGLQYFLAAQPHLLGDRP